VKLTFREKNGHISACSNSALALATGEWCALLDHDDLFAESALALVAMEIVEYPNAGMIYSDQDSISRNGVRSNPFFKSDWDPVLFLGQNFVNHLGVYKTSLLREVGGFREGYEGSQDYDLVLRCVERLRPEQVRHIPRILYHWRMVPGSVGASGEEKPYAKEAARRAIADHLVRTGIAGRVEPCPENIDHHRVIFEVPKPEPLVSIMIPMRDRVELLKQCVRSLRERTDYPRTEIIIVDNNSVEEETHRYLSELAASKTARVVEEHGPFNYSRLINRGVLEAKGEIVALLNNDVEAEDQSWLREMVSHAVRPEVGAVGARLWYPDGRMQHGGVTLGFGGVAGDPLSHLPRGHPGYWDRAILARNCSAVTAACMVMRKAVFMEVGGFNQVDLAVNFNDVEFCLHLLARGLQIVWTPYANLTHRESASRGYKRSAADQTQFSRETAYMQRRWGSELLCDPFYSPNLSLQFPGFQPAFPPRWKTCAGIASIAA
ncbi:MAG: hypothetical protein QOI96_2159, partial [Verrucomicrobiota bacterium]